MRWTPGNRGNVQDVRGGGGGGWACRSASAASSILLVGSWLTGVNLFDVVGGGGSTDVVAERPAESSPEEERLVDFVDAVMGDIQHTWSSKTRNLSADTCRPLPRLDSFGVRSVELGDRAVLLSGRSQGVSRFELLQRSPSEARRARRFRAGLRAGARGRPSRAESHRHARERSRSAATRTNGRCASSCRPIVMPACGDTRRRSPGVSPQAASSSIRATSKKG